MSIQKTNESTPAGVHVIGSGEPKQVIYADRVINAGFGPGVSKLTLAMEVSVGVYAHSATLILPTPALLEAMTAILNSVNNNPDLKASLIDGLDKFKEQLNSPA